MGGVNFCTCDICFCLDRDRVYGNLRSDTLQGALHPRLTPVVQNDSVAKFSKDFRDARPHCARTDDADLLNIFNGHVLFPRQHRFNFLQFCVCQSPTLSPNVLGDLLRRFRTDEDTGDSRKPQLPTNC